MSDLTFFWIEYALRWQEVRSTQAEPLVAFQASVHALFQGPILEAPVDLLVSFLSQNMPFEQLLRRGDPREGTCLSNKVP